MKTIIAVTLTMGAVLGILWGIMNHHSPHVSAQTNINDPLIITQTNGSVEGFAIPQAEVIFSDEQGNTTSTIADKTGKFSVNVSEKLPNHNGTIGIQQKINGLTGPIHTFQIGWIMRILNCSATEIVVRGKINTDIQIRLKNGSILSQGKTDNEGHYTGNIANVPAGSELTIIQMYGGIAFHKMYTLPPVPPKFTVTESTLAGIKGIGVPRGLMCVSQTSFGHFNFADGTFFLDFPLLNGVRPPLGSKIYLYQKKDDRSGPVQEVLVGWSQRVAPMIEASPSLTGTGSPNTPTRVQTESGQILGHGASGSNGQYAIHIAKQKVGTKLQVIQTIAGTDYMSTITVEKNPYTVSPSPFQLGNGAVTGTYAGTNLEAITKVLLLVDGVIVKNGALNTSAKTFQIAAGNLITNLQQKVEVALFSGNTELQRAPVSVTNNFQLTTSPYQLGNFAVTGTYAGTHLEAITKVVLLVNGVIVKNGALNTSAKTFQIAASNLITNLQQKVEVALFNGNTELKRTPVSVIGNYSLIPSLYSLGNTAVTGTYAGTDLEAITKVVLLVNGTIVKNGALNTSTKTFQIYASGLITNLQQKVEVALFNGNIELKRVPVSVIGNYSLSPSAFQLGNNAVTGTYTGTHLDAITKVVLLVDGVVVKNGAFDPATKTFQIYASGLVTSQHQKVEVALFNGTLELKRAPVTVSARNEYSLTPAPYQLGANAVTGSYSGTDLAAITKVVLLVNGTVVKNGALNTTTKTFQVYASGLVTSTNQKVEVALFNGRTELKRVPVSVVGI